MNVGVMLLPVMAVLLLIAGSVRPRRRWVSVRILGRGGGRALEQRPRRSTTTPSHPATRCSFQVTGPRRLKIVSRYLFAAEDSSARPTPSAC